MTNRLATGILTSFIIFSCFLFTQKKINAQTVAPPDYSGSFQSLPCTPNTNQYLTITGGSPDLKIDMGTDTKQYYGAISTLRINGTETIDKTDRGRLLQYAFQVNGQGEAYNPTEAQKGGIYFNGCTSNNKLYTSSQMAYWFTYNGLTLSPFKLAKIIEIGTLGMPNVISFTARYFIPYPVNSIHMEIPTGYHTESYHTPSVKLFNPNTNTVADPLPGEIVDNRWYNLTKSYIGPKIPILFNGQYAFAAYSPQTYANFWGTPAGNTGKWSLFAYRGPLGTGYIYSKAYLVVNTSVEKVKNDLITLITKVNGTTQTPTPTPITCIKPTAPKNVTITHLSPTRARLNWTPGTGGDKQLLRIGESERMVNYGCTDLQEIPCIIKEESIPSNQNSYTTADVLKADTTYYFRIVNYITPQCLADITVSSKTPPQNPFDLNIDGIVNMQDYNILVNNFGKVGSNGWIPSDIDKNGFVNIFDFNKLIAAFGK